MQEHFSFDTVALAIDNRPSSYGMAQACAAALADKGVNCIFMEWYQPQLWPFSLCLTICLR